MTCGVEVELDWTPGLRLVSGQGGAAGVASWQPKFA